MKKLLIIIIALHASFFTPQMSQAQQTNTPKVAKNVWFYKSKPVREMTVVLPGEHPKDQKLVPNRFYRGTEEMLRTGIPGDEVMVQNYQGHRRARGPMLNFAGVGNENGYRVPDPNGDVGLSHYVQGVNTSFGVWDKGGNLIYGPVDYQTIWASFPGPWNSLNWCDPVFTYDDMADRWIMSSMSFAGNIQPPYYTMVAVSETNDPMGAYYCYAFQFNLVNDYPKLAVWPDGYYLTHNLYEYDGTWYYHNPLVSVLDREAMLQGAADITVIEFPIPTDNIERFFPIATDMRGDSITPGIANNIIMINNHDTSNLWHLTMDVYEFNADWQTPENSTFDITAQFDLGNFEPYVPYGPGAPQLGNEINVMTIPMYMMYPATYRMFNGYESIVCCHTIWAGEIHYIKWYELRREAGDWSLFQTGNYAPEAGMHYFMPSITINSNGDIALGYTKSGEEMYPSMYLTGRRLEDDPGVMTYQELELYKGLNYINAYDAGYEQHRWGDYASMMVDPSDDSTFWYTGEYPTASSSPGNFATRVFSFDLSEDTAWPYAFAGNDTLAPGVVFFETQGEAENYSSIIWTTSGDGNFITNYSERATYLRGPGDLDNGQVTLTMHLTGYYPGTQAADSMVLYLKDTITSIHDAHPAELSLNIYPNPTRDIITVEADLSSDNQLILSIISESGKQLFTGRYKPDNRHFEQRFDLRYLPEGIYFVELRAEGEGRRLVNKIVVQ